MDLSVTLSDADNHPMLCRVRWVDWFRLEPCCFSFPSGLTEIDVKLVLPASHQGWRRSARYQCDSIFRLAAFAISPGAVVLSDQFGVVRE